MTDLSCRVDASVVAYIDGTHDRTKTENRLEIKMSYSDTVVPTVPMIHESEIGRGHLPERCPNSSVD